MPPPLARQRQQNNETAAPTDTDTKKDQVYYGAYGEFQPSDRTVPHTNGDA